MTFSATLNTSHLAPEYVDLLKSEFVRLHKMWVDGLDAANKLAAVASMLKADGIDLPETIPPVVMADPPVEDIRCILQRTTPN